MRAIRESIPDGNAGLRVKLDRARQLVDQARGDPRFRALALRLVHGVKERDWRGEIGAVSDFVRRTRYTRDPYGVELFTAPAVLADAIVRGSPQAAGDCDDVSILGASLLESLGHETRFQVGGYDAGPGDPAWAHIWLQVRDPRGGWRSVDDTAKIRPPGWSPASRFDHTMQSPASNRARSQPRLCYGGSCSTLQGFSLKKIGRAIARPIEQVAKKVVPAPIRQVYNKTVGAAWQATGNLYQKAATAIYRPLVPFMGGAVNTLLPGAGNVAQPIIDRLVGNRGRQQQAQQPNYPPAYVDQLQVPGPAADNWGPSSGSVRRSLAPASGLPPAAWAAIAGGGALVLLMLMKRKGRR